MMVKSGKTFSFSVAVEPNPTLLKALRVTYFHRVTMADVIITVSDHSSEVMDPPEMSQSGISRINRPIHHHFRYRHETQEESHRVNPPCPLRRDSWTLTSNPSHSPQGSFRLMPCEYYRNKMMCDEAQRRRREQVHEEPSRGWINYSALKVSAAHKVVQKVAAQQKALESTGSRRNNKGHGLLRRTSVPPAFDSNEVKDSLDRQQHFLKKARITLEPIRCSSNKQQQDFTPKLVK